MSTYVTEQQQLRGLTQYAIDCLNSLNARDEKALATLRGQRAVFEAEIAAIDDVMREVEATIARRQAKARGDVISQLPADQEDDSDESAASFDGVHGDLSGIGGHS